MAEPKNTGWTSARPVCAASAAAQPSYGDGRLVVDVRGQQRVVVVGEHARPAAAVKPRSAAPCTARSAAPRVPRPSTDPSRRPPASASRRRRAARARRRAPPRSILLTKSSVGMRSRCSVRISTRVCACTPSTAETTSTAPSSTLSTRSTSAMKSGWPGVSIRLTVTSSIANDTTADLIVMPRCRSSASESVWVLPVVDAADLVDDARRRRAAARSGSSYRRRHAPGSPGSAFAPMLMSSK